ncbi:odorant receptor 131-2-like [Solea solea]|uniref:odorant receptor 131-2-like n=1 Tax=Solea solea TaxID=90069 RepID=UPI00272D4382|nr:odorant receptor 131-2-like [Solea solea]
MNSSKRTDSVNEAVMKNFIVFIFSVGINCINGAFVYIYFKSEVFRREPRYVLFVHLVINDMILLTLSVMLQILTYTTTISVAPCCLILVILITTAKNSPLNLAGMAVERYIAICRPLHHVQICTVRRAYTLIALIWGGSLMLALADLVILFATQPLFLFSRKLLCHKMSIFNTPYHKTLSEVVQVLLFSFVSLTLIVTYLKVFLVSRAASRAAKASARNACNTILLHGIQLFICMFSYLSPYIILALITACPRNRTTILTVTFLFFNVLPRLLSPLIYGIRDKKFSSQIRQHLFQCCNVVEMKKCSSNTVS